MKLCHTQFVCCSVCSLTLFYIWNVCNEKSKIGKQKIFHHKSEFLVNWQNLLLQFHYWFIFFLFAFFGRMGFCSIWMSQTNGNFVNENLNYDENRYTRNYKAIRIWIVYFYSMYFFQQFELDIFLNVYIVYLLIKLCSNCCVQEYLFDALIPIKTEAYLIWRCFVLAFLPVRNI